MNILALQRFAALVRAQTLEEAAGLTEGFDACDTKHIAAAIRALKGEQA